MREKLADLARRFDELTARMADPEVYAEPGAFQKIAREAAEIEPVVKCWRELESVLSELSDAREMLTEEDDPEMRGLAEEEVSALEGQETTLRADLRLLLLPKDPNDQERRHRNPSRDRR
jgi:peptide chain release factor 1